MAYSHSRISVAQILDKAEAEIKAAEKDIFQWKLEDLKRDQSEFSRNNLEKNSEGVGRSHRECSSLTLENQYNFTELKSIEKRLQALESSREVEILKSFKKISKLEKMVEEITYRSASHFRMENKIFRRKRTSSRVKKREKSGNSRNMREKSAGKSPNTKRLCIYIRQLEDEVEKFKFTAGTLEKKYFTEVKDLRNKIMATKIRMNKEINDLRSYCDETCKPKIYIAQAPYK